MMFGWHLCGLHTSSHPLCCGFVPGLWIFGQPTALSHICCRVLCRAHRMLCCAVAGDDKGELRLADLMAAAAAGPASAAASSIRSARKLLERMEKQSAPLSVPLPRTVAERVERQAGYEDTKQDVTKWQPIVKVSGWVDGPQGGWHAGLLKGFFS